MNTEGEWTATPPHKTGWYWWRKGEGEWPFVMLVHFRNDKLWLSGYGVHTAFDKPSLDLMRGEWWTVPIQEPPA